MTKQKRYPFSAQKHAHDIELVYNRIKNRLYDMQSGEAPMDRDEYDRLYDYLHGELAELLDEVYGNGCAPVVWLTGKQIATAKHCVMLASEWRAQSCIERGRLDLLQYC